MHKRLASIQLIAVLTLGGCCGGRRQIPELHGTNGNIYLRSVCTFRFEKFFFSWITNIIMQINYGAVFVVYIDYL